MKSVKTTARVAGLLYLLQIPLGVFGIVYIPKQLIAKGDLASTISNIASNEFLFRLSIVSAILCALLTIGTAVFIAKTLRSVNRHYAKWIVIFTLLVAPITLINELNNVAILHLIKNTDKVVNFPTNEVKSLVGLFLNVHEYGIKIIDIFFGLWLLPMGYLIIKSNYIPKIIGFLLLITCCGYLIDFTTFFLLPDFNVVVSEYVWLGELLMVLWLLIKGVDAEQYAKYGPETVLD